MRYKLGEKPTIIFDALNQNIYGLTGDKNNLYFSLDSGIVKINRDQRSEYILGKGIKGKIQIFNNRIYVLDSDDRKLYSVALEWTEPQNISKKWTQTLQNLGITLAQLSIFFGQRLKLKILEWCWVLAGITPNEYKKIVTEDQPLFMRSHPTNYTLA